LALPSHAAEGERPIETSNTETNRSSLAATQKADLIAPNTYPFYSPPQCARTEADIHFTIGTTNRHGQFEFLQPEKRHFRWQKRDYLVAIDNDIIGMGGESYTHAWLYIYNKAFKDWRCFQVSHFRCVGGLVAVFDAQKGEIGICGEGAGTRPITLTTFNLAATSDDASYVR